MARCHSHGNQNIVVALTIHTRQPLDLGVVQVGLQELQHQNPQLTARIQTIGSRQVFAPMECPVLPLDTQFACSDFIHEQFNIETGPLWRVQIVSQTTLELARINFGPEVEAIIEDDSNLETRWRYLLRYMQGQLNRDIENFGESEDEEGRSIVFISFHPSITDVPGSLNLAKQFMDILELKLQTSDEPLSLGGTGEFPPSLETILPSSDSVFHFTDLVPLVKAVGGHFMNLKRSACDNLLVDSASANGNEPRSKYLRGWLTEAETREVVGRCEEDEVTLHGLVLAAALTAMARMCTVQGEAVRALRACIATNIRQYCTQAPRTGLYSSVYEDSFQIPSQLSQPKLAVTSQELWCFAQLLTTAHNTAKANKMALRHVRMVGRTIASGSLDNTFKEMEDIRKVEAEMHLNILGDIGHIFREENNEKHQVLLEDVGVMVSGQNMGYPLSHTAHIFRNRLNYMMTYYTNYLETSTALLLRDETINLLRLASEQE
ncbi:uncharacterized protein LOC111708242 isoform X2 [Eurytemora carolleeae]|uniref:uncharacterized protein LOC111708242 isoform X2 n=1 Tax=Eurytemora carolleeae TaxID=1294199 RepID=UPI000C783571|nr:uncharacterized protein LOC111708242 isoform X2 [Eurytemora carolleeae]|eukprot:XP_023337320.1 uncharacterized protein LOC111708242 isoform X2 [Eurytemora affinis]